IARRVESDRKRRGWPLCHPAKKASHGGTIRTAAQKRACAFRICLASNGILYESTKLFLELLERSIVQGLKLRPPPKRRLVAPGVRYHNLRRLHAYDVAKDRARRWDHVKVNVVEDGLGVDPRATAFRNAVSAVGKGDGVTLAHVTNGMDAESI